MDMGLGVRGRAAERIPDSLGRRVGARTRMKQVLDRLMARQQRLLGRLHAPPAAAVRVDVPCVEERQAKGLLEGEAIVAALEQLSQGNIPAAKVLLTPFADDAALV